MNDLTEQRNTMLEAKLNDKLKDWSMTDAALLLAGLIAKCYQKSNLNFKTEYPLEEMALDVFEDAAKDHPNATMAQVVDAIQRGTKGEYGPYVGLSTITLLGFVTKYLEPKITINKQQEEEEEPKLLERDVRQDKINYVCFLYDLHKKDEKINAADWVAAFNFMKRNGAVCDYSSERDAMIEAAIEKLVGKALAHMSLQNIGATKKYEQEIREQREGHQEVASLCKKAAVIYTFNEWMREEMTVDDVRHMLDDLSKEIDW